MIPSSLAGVALTIALLAPGLAYVLRHERVVPARSHSPFRETLRVFFVSVACLTATALLASGIRWALPDRTPNFGSLVQHPTAYAAGHHVQLLWWSFGLLAAATLMGAVFADPRVVRMFEQIMGHRIGRWLTGATDTAITSVSAWYRVMHVFDDDDPGPICVGAQMDDGTYVEGRMYTFNVASEDDEDRDMILAGPIFLTTLDGVRHATELQFTVISARHIVRLDVTHLPPSKVGEELAPVPPQPTAKEPLTSTAASDAD